MKSYVVLIILSLILAGCGQTAIGVPIKVERTTITQIPEEFLNCSKQVPTLPDPKKLTDKQISSLIIRYEKAIKHCVKNEEYIRKYLRELKVELDRIQGK